MNRSAALILFISILLVHPVLSHGNDYSGQWLGTITESKNLCKKLGKAEPGDYKLTITQQGEDIVIMENVVQRPYRGRINPERPNFFHVQGSYVDDGGYVSELVDIEFESETAGKGISVWRWSDGYYACAEHLFSPLRKSGPENIVKPGVNS